MTSSSVKPLGVHLARSSAYSSGVSTLAMWLLWLLRSGNSSSAGKRSFSVLWLLEKGMAAEGCGRYGHQRGQAHPASQGPADHQGPAALGPSHPGYGQGQWDPPRARRGNCTAQDPRPCGRTRSRRESPSCPKCRMPQPPGPSVYRAPALAPSAAAVPALGPTHPATGCAGSACSFHYSGSGAGEQRLLRAPEALKGRNAGRPLVAIYSPFILLARTAGWCRPFVRSPLP